MEGVQWIQVKSKEECKKVFTIGEKNRAVGATKSNINSSRSHAILIVRLEKKISNNINNENNVDITVNKSQLFLVDLAGSERIKKSKAQALRLEEAKKINSSLLILGNCIQALSEKNSFIPYRDSKLTRILQESLGGNAKTSLIVTVSPSILQVEETVCSLSFGNRAMKVQNKPILNKLEMDFETLCKKLNFDLDKLNDEYLRLKDNYHKLVEENEMLKENLKKADPIRFARTRKRDSKSLSSNDLQKSENILNCITLNYLKLFNVKKFNEKCFF